MFDAVITWIVETVNHWGYFGIFVAMFLESSFFPFPSEVIMIPAGYLAYQGQMSLLVAILLGMGGSLAGALFNYWLAVVLGRPLLERYGRYILLKPETLDKLNLFFRKHGEISTFSGRLIPGIRQYISLPAGLSRMHLGRFVLFTSLGAGLWVSILVVLGYVVGQNEALVGKYLHDATLIAFIFVVGLIVFYWLRHRAKEVDV